MKWSMSHKIAIAIVAVFAVICIIFVIKALSINSTTIVPTFDQYSQINQHMHYEDVKNVMGCDGRLVKENDTPGSIGYFVEYEWGAPGASKTITVTFNNDGVWATDQTGLI